MINLNEKERTKMDDEKEECEEEELDDLLEDQWKMQDQIHKKCKMKEKDKHKF